jgi:hypothetical protein
VKRFLLDVVAPLRRSDPDRAERPLHWLLAAAIVLPAALFVTGATISYRQHLTDARDRLQRNLGTVYEHGLKVFETFEITARYLDELLSDVTDEQIRADEALYNARLRAFTDTLPQLFRHLGDRAPTAARSCPGRCSRCRSRWTCPTGVFSRAPRQPGGRRACRRGGAGARHQCAGASALLHAQPQAQRPERRVRRRDDHLDLADYFAEYYARLDAAAGRRADPPDGLVLALSGAARASASASRRRPTDAIAAAAKRIAQWQLLRSTIRSAFRLSASCRGIAFMSTTGVPTRDIRAAWIEHMSRHLIFGFPRPSR